MRSQDNQILLFYLVKTDNTCDGIYYTSTIGHGTEYLTHIAATCHCDTRQSGNSYHYFLHYTFSFYGSTSFDNAKVR